MPKDRVLVCPECGSTDLYPEMGFMTGYQYHCGDCGYVGAFVIERDVEGAGEEGVWAEENDDEALVAAEADDEAEGEEAVAGGAEEEEQDGEA